MNQQAGFTKENIDKSKVLISEHAKKQLIMRVEEAYCFFYKQGMGKKKRRQKVGLPHIASDQEAEFWIQFLLEKSTPEHAATAEKNVDAILKYLESGELTFYFRYERWQFVIKRCDENPSQFIIKTIMWLDDSIYSRFKK